MQKHEIKTECEVYDHIDQLLPEDKMVLQNAIAATKTAYAPYSHFHVGAAALLENGEIVRGSNQENAAYPSGLCAERVAVFYCGAHYPDCKIKTLAVTAFLEGNTLPAPVSPCGDCRQVMAEYEHRYHTDIRFIMIGSGSKIFVFKNVKALLPFMFNADSLFGEKE